MIIAQFCEGNSIMRKYLAAAIFIPALFISQQAFAECSGMHASVDKVTVSSVPLQSAPAPTATEESAEEATVRTETTPEE